MKKHNQDGAANVLILPLILACVFLAAALGFGYWAFSGRQDYKDNVDQKIGVAVTAAKQQESTTKDKEFAEASKNPLKTYNGPQASGGIVMQYPRTWSAYVDTTGSDTPLDGYFEPDVIPSITSSNSNFALRVQVINQPYSSIMSSFVGQGSDQPVTISPYSLPKVPKVVGSRVEGSIQENKQGSMIVLPVRNSTLEIYTQDSNYESDFNNIILPNFTFLP